MAKEKKQTVWDLPRLRERAKELIQGGLLVKEKDPEVALAKTLSDEFKDALKKQGLVLNAEAVKDALPTLIWTEGKTGTLTALKGVVRRGGSPGRLEKFQSAHPYIPLPMVEQRVRDLSGMTQVEAHAPLLLHGINRIGGEGGIKRVEDFEIPSATTSRPFVIQPKDTKHWRFMIINGANIGLKHARVMEDNPVRQALSTAERLGCDTVFLTNLLDLDLTKAGGPLKALRALSSGRNVNVAILDPSYREEAMRILNTLPDDEVIYETANEVFEDLLTGWEKITHLPKRKPYEGRPEFSGKTYIVLGRKEEDFIVAAAYWDIRYATIKRQQANEMALKTARNALGKAQKEGNESQVKRLTKEIERLAKLKARFATTAVRDQDFVRKYLAMLAYVIGRFEQSIPNCKVIGVNTTHISFGGKTIELSVPDHVKVTDMLLSNRVGAHGPQVLRKDLADAIIVCHPYPLNARFTARERDADGKRGHSYFAVAPMCVDSKFLREALRHIIRKVHPINKAVFNEQFQPGVLLVETVNGVLMPPEPISIGALDKFRMRTKDFGEEGTWGVRNTTSPILFPATRYLWYFISTDIHIGSRNRAIVWCKETGTYLGMFEAVCYMMRREGLLGNGKMPPVHMFSSNDDVTQGNHFETHLQPHVHELSRTQIEDTWRKEMDKAKRAPSKGAALEIFANMRELMLYQLEIRGLDWTQQQVLEVFEKLVEQNLDMYRGILQRAEHAKLKIRGVSKFAGVPYDSRDPGVINIGTGNHFVKTIDRRMAEGPLYADKIRALLRTYPEFKDEGDALRDLVKAPLDGSRFISYGTVKVNGGYEWGLDMRDTPTGGVDWNDPLRPTVLKEMRRGNPSRVLEGRMIVRTYGDKHFLSFIITPGAIFLMGPPGTHTDVYGEHGFPPNNTGVVFLGLPVDGPDGGPILVRPLLFDDIKRIIESKESFDWEKFLPNPA
ncbi:MAG: hypothetical protein HY455_03415 [Parcubacteria group bacterium]|nr:hypothetical protein [Parcubacteria group bacterium]